MHPRLLTRLDMETRSYHAGADAPWLDLLSGLHVAQRYRAHLLQVYAFEGPLEAALAYTPHLPSLIDLRRRMRSGLLAQDLLALGCKPAQLAQVEPCMIAPFRGAAEALGWLYVMERSSFAHAAVYGRLLARTPALGDASAYLESSIDNAAARRDELASVLDAIAHTSQVEHQIVISAHDAFRGALHWYHGSRLQARGA